MLSEQNGFLAQVVLVWLSVTKPKESVLQVFPLIGKPHLGHQPTKQDGVLHPQLTYPIRSREVVLLDGDDLLTIELRQSLTIRFQMDYQLASHHLRFYQNQHSVLHQIKRI